MGNFNKRVLNTRRINFFGLNKKDQPSAGAVSNEYLTALGIPLATPAGDYGGTIGVLGAKGSGFSGSTVALDSGVALKSGLGKRCHTQFLGGTTTITEGIEVTDDDQVLESITLTTAYQIYTIAGTESYATGALTAQPDFPRNITAILASPTATCGNGTLVGASAKVAGIFGTDVNDLPIIEWLALNDTNTVSTIRCFKTVTRVVLPPRANASDSIKIGVGVTFPLERPIELLADVIEFSRKASAAVAYTIEALPTLTNFCAPVRTYVNTTALPALTAAASATSTITLASATGWVDSTQNQVAELIAPDGTVEIVRCTTRSTTALTVVRNVDVDIWGTTPNTALNAITAPAWPIGSILVFRSQPNFTTTITGNDRLQVVFKTPVF